MRILLIEPYYTGSHQAWADGYRRSSSHQVELLCLPGRFWKWRMHGGAVTLARRFREMDFQPDLILTTDMLDLTTFLALTRDLTHDVPTALYFHENQLIYPVRRGEKRDLHYGFINYASALVADRVFFNSAYHEAAFFDELPRLLKHFPDYNELESIAQIRAKSQVLPLGLDLTRHDRHRPTEPKSGRPLILWNHRWEYDKNPQEFFNAVYALDGMGLDFGLILLGESFRVKPEEFLEARGRLSERILHFGYVGDAATYSRLLWQADICVSTAHHEFFGVATLEAIYCGCFPILPNRLAYPEIIPPQYQIDCLYDDFEGLLTRLREAVVNIGRTRQKSLRSYVEQYDWAAVAPVYDSRLESILKQDKV